MFGAKMLEFKQNGDERGYLVVVEGLKDIPFEIKRMFYIYGTEANVVRGNHANLRSEFVLINLVGTSKVKVDNSEEQRIFVLDRPHIGIYLPRMYWKEMYDFSADSVLMVLSSEGYDPQEYVKSYTVFKEMTTSEGEAKQ
jgi:dTDP-4-dehydrorhamnose 3,5-epimerase-like enzyme